MQFWNCRRSPLTSSPNRQPLPPCAASGGWQRPGNSPTEQLNLLGVGKTTFYQWKQGKVAALDRHVLERLSYLFGIYAALHILLPVPERANAWLRKPNQAPFLGGQSALRRMLGGQVADLFVVRQYLDAQRGGKA